MRIAIRILMLALVAAVLGPGLVRYVVLNYASLTVAEGYLTTAPSSSQRSFSVSRRTSHPAALTHTAWALAVAPKIARVRRQRGWALLLHGRRSEAATAFQRTLYLSPTDIVARDATAQLHFEQGEIETATAMWTSLRAPARLTLLGSLLQRSEQPDRAIAAYRTAIEVYPTFAGAYYPLGWLLYRHTGDLSAALDVFHTQRRANPRNPWSYVNIGDLYTESGQIAKALPWYAQAYTVAPFEPNLDMKLAWAYVTYGDTRCAAHDPDEARRAYRMALTIVPSYASARRALSHLRRDAPCRESP